MYSVDIDVGGTLTDGLFSDGTQRVCAKVDSTPHDLTVCLFDCLTKGAAQLGYPDLSTFLEHVDLLRWSTTLTSNVLAELRGPKIGLIVSKGHERDLYGSLNPSPILNRIVSEQNVIGIENTHDARVLTVVHSLLEQGVRRICISLGGALQNPRREQQIKQLIDEQYPDHYLGSVPVLAGTDICQNTDDMTRTYYAVINAYTHSALAATLFKAEDELRYVQGYTRAFLISHINGGVAGVSKTRAIDTMESGPVLGLYGSRYLAAEYGLKNVIALDVGGTTAKVGVIQNGQPAYSQESDLFGIPVRVRLPYLRSIALGGGSVVKHDGGRVQLGPESMGSFPGPACYALGGEKPTLTDAFVTAGWIDPGYFLGGTKHLDLELAREAIETQVAGPLGMSSPQACRAVIESAYDVVAAMIARAAHELDSDLANYVLFAYGGNGGLFACGVAERVAIGSVYLFSLGPVFSAFGSSVSDISHVYERSFHMPVHDGADVESLNHLMDEMRAAGERDLLGEGINPARAEYVFEFEVSDAGKANSHATCAALQFADLDQLRRCLVVEGSEASLELVRLQVHKAITRPELVRQSVGPQDSSSAMLGRRKVACGSSQGEARLYKWESLQPGNEIEGCAILLASNSTYFLPEGWKLQIDAYGNARIARRGRTAESPDARQEVRSYGRD